MNPPLVLLASAIAVFVALNYANKAQDLGALFAQYETQYSLPAGLLSAIARRESNYNHAARGAAGEIGMMQIMPQWHPDCDIHSLRGNIECAAAYLRENFDRFGTWADAIAAYNWGPTNISNKGFSAAPETVKNYVAAVQSWAGLAGM